MQLYSCIDTGSIVLVIHVHVVLHEVPSTKLNLVPALVLFFNINLSGPHFQILATRPIRFWATRPQFWFMTLTTQPLEKWSKDQNHGTGTQI